MSFNFGKIFEAIETNISIENANEFMAIIIETCNEVEPDTAWGAYKNLDYENESNRLSSHMYSVLKGEPATFSEKGIWFGINNPVLENDETSAGIYFSVSSQYSPEDEDADWACEAEHYPEKREFPSKLMNRIYAIAYSESNLGNKAEYSLCLAYGVKLAQKSIRFYKAKNPGVKLGAAVGFDSGDFINLGWQ